MSLGAACGNVPPSPPDGRHDAQLLGDFLERGVLRESLESIDHGLLIRHEVHTTASEGPPQEASSTVGRAPIGAAGDELQLSRAVRALGERHDTREFTRAKVPAGESPFGRSQTLRSERLRQPASSPHHRPCAVRWLQRPFRPSP